MLEFHSSTKHIELDKLFRPFHKRRYIIDGKKHNLIIKLNNQTMNETSMGKEYLKELEAEITSTPQMSGKNF